MTRINVGVPPKLLDDWRLIAEINEIPRVKEVYDYRLRNKINFSDIPKQFTLGKGHVLFFLNKGLFIYERYNSLVVELIRRDLIKKYNLTSDKLKIDPRPLLEFRYDDFKGYKYTQEDINKVITRIIDKIKSSDKFPYYNGVSISKIEAINLLLQIGTYNEKKDLTLF